MQETYPSHNAGIRSDFYCQWGGIQDAADFAQKGIGGEGLLYVVEPSGHFPAAVEIAVRVP